MSIILSFDASLSSIAPVRRVFGDVSIQLSLTPNTRVGLTITSTGASPHLVASTQFQDQSANLDSATQIKSHQHA